MVRILGEDDVKYEKESPYDVDQHDCVDEKESAHPRETAERLISGVNSLDRCEPDEGCKGGCDN